MTTQFEFQESGQEFLEHYGTLGMKWGHRIGASITSENTKSFLKKSGKMTAKGAVKSGKVAAKVVVKSGKMTAKVATKLGAVKVLSILGVIGLTAVTTLVVQNTDAVEIGKDTVAKLLDDVGVTHLSPSDRADIGSRGFFREKGYDFYSKNLPKVDENNAR